MNRSSKIIGTVLLSCLLAVGASATWTFSNFNHSFEKTADCAVVFGAKVFPDGRPSNALADRTVAAVKLYKNEQVSCLIFSGADPEPAVMAKIAHNLGIDNIDERQDTAGVDTLATLRNLNPAKSYVLVSNDFHLGRIRMLADRLGLNAKFHAAPYRHGRYTNENYFIAREIVATLWYAIRPLDI